MLIHDLKKINEQYYFNDSLLSYKTSIYYFSKENPFEIFDSIHAQYFKQGQQIKMYLGEIIMLYNNRLHVLVDSKEETIKINTTPDLNMEIYKEKWIPYLLDSNIKYFSINRKKGNEITLMFNCEQIPTLDSLEITYNKVNYFISNIKFYYANPGVLDSYDYGDFKPVLHIRLYDYKVTPKNETVFHESQFIQNINNKYYGAHSYRDYSITINQALQ